ncbi:unnamed protein product [Phyllotreta striolata]|uniref:maleylacetoacetate isomerase n=1 Tax=Phyllotreta striolata TaxID=444603 RepID=A0A9N9XKN2_PHYSR|nr:unnamed protein product [Phyllotreta striolata]
MGKTILYSFWISSCSWRVRLALNLKCIPYELKTLLLAQNGEQHSEEYRKINPMQQVPSLYIDENIVTESLNIMHYLEETRPQIPLLPNDKIERAKARQISEIIVSGIQPYQNLILLTKFPKENQADWASFWINRGFKAVEGILAGCSGKYSVGDKITIADCCLIPQIFHAKHRFNVNLEKYPNIQRIDEILQNHPAFLEAHPNNQPDKPIQINN